MDDTGQAASGTADPDTLHTQEQFAQALTELREVRGLSIRQVARVSGVPPATLGGYFSGRHLPALTQMPVLDALLDALGVVEADDQQAWHAALRRVRSNPQRRTTSQQPAPYRGLEPYTEQDAALFFGRDSVVAQLCADITALSRSGGGLLVLVGPSGSGKSSVLRAGLVQRLDGEFATTVLVPGTDPLGSLQLALESVADRTGRVVVIDQAEEVFSPEVGPDTRHEFLQRLTQLAAGTNGSGCVVVLALRADFYGQAANEPQLVDSLRDSQVLLGAMSLEELRSAVLLPAQAAGVGVDDDLIGLLLRDLSGQRPGSFAYDAGALPLVSHALLSTWQHHTGPSMTASDYLAVGGLHGAVKQSAEEVYTRFDESGRTAAQWLFGQLVLVDPDGAMTRRRIGHETLHHPQPEIDAALDTVIEAFVAGRLLTAQESTIEISHEALLTAWPRLHEWVLADLDSARLQSRIAESARLWHEHGHDPDLLLRGGPLLDAQGLIDGGASAPRVLTEEERAFIDSSSAQQAAAVALEKSRRKRLHRIVAVTTVLAITATLLAAVAYWSQSEATAQRGQAEQARDEALSAQLGIASDTVRPRDPAAAAQLALAGYTISSTLTSRSALLDSTAVPTPMRFVGPDGEMHATMTSDGGLLATSGKDGVTRLWQRTAEGTYTRLPDLPPASAGQPGPVWASGFSPDDRTLVVADVGDPESTVQFWDLTDPARPVIRRTGTVRGSVQSLAFAPDGGQVLVGTSTGTILGWSMGATISKLPAKTGFDGQVMSLSFSPRGDSLAVGIDAGSIAVLSGEDFGNRRIATLPAGSSVNSVAFSPDGRTIASGQKSGDVRIWRVSRGSAPRQEGAAFGDFQSWVNAVGYSKDGKVLAAASSDGHTRLFSMPARVEISDLPGPAAFTSVQFVEDGTALLTGEVGGIAHLWPLPSPVLPGFADVVWSLHTDTPNRLLLVGPGAADGALYLFELDDRAEPTALQTLRSAEAGPTDGSSAISGNGSWVAGGTGDGHVAVWERRGRQYEPAGVAKAGTTIVQNVAISSDGSLMAAVDDGALLSLWHLATGQPPKKFSETSLGAGGLAVGISPDGGTVAAGLTDGTVRLWSVDGTEVTAGPVLAGFSSYVNVVAFDPSGRYLAAASNDQTVRLWEVGDPADPQPVGEPLQGPGGAVYGLAFNADSSRLAAGSKDGTVWLWNMNDPSVPDVVATMHSPATDILSVTFGPGDSLFGAGADNAVSRWRTDVPAVARQICTTTGEGLGATEWAHLMPSMPFISTC